MNKKALSTAFGLLGRKEATPAQVSVTPPPELVSDILNAGGVRAGRWVDAKGRSEDYLVHVSDVIRFAPQERFCPREHVIGYFEGKPPRAEKVTAGFEMLFCVGNAVQRHIVDNWIARSPYGKLAWGVWVCPCGQTRQVGSKPPFSPANVCRRCKVIPKHYHEYSVHDHDTGLVGHPDFLLRWKNKLLVYEIKSIDRKKVPFDTLDGPLADHLLQASMYWHMLHREGEALHDEVRVLYVDRSNEVLFRGKPFKEFAVKPYPLQRIQPVFDAAWAVQHAIASGVLPPRICELNSCTRAKACSHVVSCFSRRHQSIHEIRDRG